MADAKTPTAGSRPPKVQLAPVTVEFGDPNNRTITINCLRQRVRGSWSLGKLHARPEGGRDVGGAMTGMPDIPGLRMKIIPKDHKAILYDPLEDDPDRIARINRVAERARAIYKGAPFTFVPASEFELNPDMLKTLLIELNRKVDTRCCVVVDGTLPGLDDIAKLDGRQLYDPWNNGRKPTYVDEVDDWMGRLDEQQV